MYEPGTTLGVFGVAALTNEKEAIPNKRIDRILEESRAMTRILKSKEHRYVTKREKIHERGASADTYIGERH